MIKKVFIASVIMIALMCTASASIVTFYNENGTGIILHPSLSFAYYNISKIIGSTSKVIIDSDYIVISNTPFHVESNAPINVTINSWNPEYIHMGNQTIFNFTISTEYHNQTVKFCIGNLTTDIPLVVYKDNKPWFIMYSDQKYTFEGNNTTIVSPYSFVFSDGIKLMHNITKNMTKIADVVYHINKYTNIPVIVHGKVMSVNRFSGKTIATISDGTGVIQVEIPFNTPVTTGNNVTVMGNILVHNGTPMMKMRRMYINKISTGFSTHTYVIKTLYSTAAASPLFGAPTSFGIFEFTGYAMILAIIVPLALAGYVVYRKLRGM